MEKEQKTSNYLGSAYHIRETDQFFINLKPEYIEKLEPDKYGKIKVAIMKFQKGGQVGYSAYLHSGNIRPNITVLLLQLDKDKLLKMTRAKDRNGQETIKLTSSSKNPDNITAEKMDIVVYANKYSEEMKDWTKEEKNNALRPKPEDFVGGGWKTKQLQGKEGNVMQQYADKTMTTETNKTKKQNL